jgi:hypothetical protein
LSNGKKLRGPAEYWMPTQRIRMAARINILIRSYALDDRPKSHQNLNPASQWLDDGDLCWI